MKIVFALIASLALCLGCVDPKPEPVTQPYDDFESAIEAIATSEDMSVAYAAAAQIYSGGVPAIDALRKYLGDDRVIPSGFCSRSVNSRDITVKQQASWTIEDLVETGLPKVYDNSYYVLRDGNLEQWLDQRKGMSITGLEIEAASAQLQIAKQLKLGGDPYATAAIEIIDARLMELYRVGQE